MEHQLAAGGGGVDRLGQRAQADAALTELLDQLLERAGLEWPPFRIYSPPALPHGAGWARSMDAQVSPPVLVGPSFTGGELVAQEVSGPARVGKQPRRSARGCGDGGLRRG